MNTREVVTDVILGSQASPVPPAARPVNENTSPEFPVLAAPPVRPVLELPTSTFTPPTPGQPPTPPTPIPVPACPTADPIAPIRVSASQSVNSPPVAATYAYRNDGMVDITGPNARKAPVPVEATREVRDVEQTQDGIITYRLVTTTGAETSSTSFRISPVTDASVNDPTKGIFVTEVSRPRADGSVDVFRPVPALQVLPFPAVPGKTWEATGTDPISQTSMRFVGTITGQVAVDACGTPLGSWQVEISEGRTVGNTSGVGANPKNLFFTGTYAFATQFGGLPVQERIAIEGADGPSSISIQNLSTINSEPSG